MATAIESRKGTRDVADIALIWALTKKAAPGPPGANTAGETIVYRPGGTPSTNVYTTPATFSAALAAAQGVLFVTIDDSIADAHLTAAESPWNLSNAVLFGWTAGATPRTGAPATLILDDGATGSLPIKLSYMRLLNEGTSAPFATTSASPASGSVLILGDLAQLVTDTGKQPILSTPEGTTQYVDATGYAVVCGNTTDAWWALTGDGLFVGAAPPNTGDVILQPNSLSGTGTFTGVTPYLDAIAAQALFTGTVVTRAFNLQVLDVLDFLDTGAEIIAQSGVFPQGPSLALSNGGLGGFAIAPPPVTLGQPGSPDASGAWNADGVGVGWTDASGDSTVMGPEVLYAGSPWNTQGTSRGYPGPDFADTLVGPSAQSAAASLSIVTTSTPEWGSQVIFTVIARVVSTSGLTEEVGDYARVTFPYDVVFPGSTYSFLAGSSTTAYLNQLGGHTMQNGWALTFTPVDGTTFLVAVTGPSGIDPSTVIDFSCFPDSKLA